MIPKITLGEGVKNPALKQETWLKGVEIKT